MSSRNTDLESSAWVDHPDLVQRLHYLKISATEFEVYTRVVKNQILAGEMSGESSTEHRDVVTRFVPDAKLGEVLREMRRDILWSIDLVNSLLSPRTKASSLHGGGDKLPGPYLRAFARTLRRVACNLVREARKSQSGKQLLMPLSLGQNLKNELALSEHHLRSTLTHVHVFLGFLDMEGNNYESDDECSSSESDEDLDAEDEDNSTLGGDIDWCVWPSPPN